MSQDRAFCAIFKHFCQSGPGGGMLSTDGLLVFFLEQLSYIVALFVKVPICFQSDLEKNEVKV